MTGWGLFPWFEECGEWHIHPDDRQKLRVLGPYCRLFRRLGSQGEYIVIRFGSEEYRVRPNLFKEKGAPVFEVNQKVRIKKYPEKKCRVRDMIWHYKENREFYLLIVDGKKKPRRYWAEELEPDPGRS